MIEKGGQKESKIGKLCVNKIESGEK